MKKYRAKNLESNANKASGEGSLCLHHLRLYSCRRGFTLVELIIVVAILVALACAVIPMIGSSLSTSQTQATKASLGALRDTIMGTSASPGYWGDLRQTPKTIADLFLVPTYLPATSQTYNRNTGRGWRGPYVQNQSGTYILDADGISRGFTSLYTSSFYDPSITSPDPAVLDPWGHPFVIQVPTLPPPAPSTEPMDRFVRLVSAGPDGIIQTSPDDSYPLQSSRGDDVVIFLRRADTLP